MIIEYHRPSTIEKALELLSRPDPVTWPLGGGTVLNQPSPDPMAVVDLQALGLDTLEIKGKDLILGASLTLERLLQFPETPLALKKAIRHEAAYNLRQAATVAGTLVAADGRSPFATAMLALGVELTFLPDDRKVGLGSFLPLRNSRKPGSLITQVSVPQNVELAYEYVARTPADLPIVCAAAAQWSSGRTRLALGGFGKAPLLAMDGPQPDGVEAAARQAYEEAGDPWASAEYRAAVAATLARRCLQALTKG